MTPPFTFHPEFLNDIRLFCMRSGLAPDLVGIQALVDWVWDRSPKWVKPDPLVVGVWLSPLPFASGTGPETLCFRQLVRGGQTTLRLACILPLPIEEVVARVVWDARLRSEINSLACG